MNLTISNLNGYSNLTQLDLTNSAAPRAHLEAFRTSEVHLAPLAIFGFGHQVAFHKSNGARLAQPAAEFSPAVASLVAQLWLHFGRNFST